MSLRHHGQLLLSTMEARRLLHQVQARSSTEDDFVASESLLSLSIVGMKRDTGSGSSSELDRESKVRRNRLGQTHTKSLQNGMQTTLTAYPVTQIAARHRTKANHEKTHLTLSFTLMVATSSNSVPISSHVPVSVITESQKCRMQYPLPKSLIVDLSRRS